MNTMTTSASPYQTIAEALGAMDNVEVLAMLFETWALSGCSVPELVASAAYTATERLPRGMSLTDQRPGCWESSLFESMAPESAVMAGPGPEPLDVFCDHCGADAGEACFHMGNAPWTGDSANYGRTKHPHRQRVEWAASPERTCYAGEWV